MVGTIYDPLKYAQMEEERRFLLQELPVDLDIDAFSRIVDHYLPGTRLRLRRIESSDEKVLVYKFGQKYRAARQGAHQTMMTNIYLDEVEYKTLARLGGAQLVKRRYRYLHARLQYSIDVFEGSLSGLILAEIEGQSSMEIAKLPIPSFAVREVTNDLKFTGGVLAELSGEEFQRWRDVW